MKMIKIRGILAGLAFLFAGTASAAPIAIDSMFVENVSATLSVTGLGSVTAATGIDPAAEITMGSFQSSIYSLTDLTSGFNINIYSAGLNAPSGTVDGNVIDVDFSSFRIAMTYDIYSYDGVLWPLITDLDYGIYTPIDSGFNIGWSDSLTINMSSIFSTDATLKVGLEGYLTTVPVPAAIWLFGMGLVSLFGFSQASRKQK